MTWSYNVTDLSTSEKDQIRLEIGDNVDGQSVTLADEEIEQAITAEGSFWGAAARCAEQLSRKFLRMADVRVGRGGTSLIYSTAAQQYTEMAAALRGKSAAIAVPWAGGTSISDKVALAQDTDAVQPIFTKTMQENPYVGGEGSDSATDDGQGTADQ